MYHMIRIIRTAAAACHVGLAYPTVCKAHGQLQKGQEESGKEIH